MIPAEMLPQNVVHAYHLRAPSTSGGKDWVCILSTHPFHSKHLWAVFGKTGDVLNGGGQGRALTTTLATETALTEAVRKKLNGKDKYEIVDEYEARCGWHSQPSSQPSPPTATQTTPTPPSPPKAARKVKTPKPPAAPAAPTPQKQEEIGEPTMCW